MFTDGRFAVGFRVHHQADAQSCGRRRCRRRCVVDFVVLLVFAVFDLNHSIIIIINIVLMNP